MCLIKVKPEIEEEPSVPARIAAERRDARYRRASESAIIETIPPPPPPETLVRETQIVQTTPPGSVIESTGGGAALARHGDHWDRTSPRASVVSTHSRDYYVDGSVHGSRGHSGRGPHAHAGYRYVEPRNSATRLEGHRRSRSKKELGEKEYAERYGYHNYHGRRSGSVHYVNPRHSTASHRSGRSTRDKVVVVDREKDYY